MSHTIEGEDVSLWLATTPKTAYSPLTNDTETYDLAIVGGGITGIVAAHYAQEKGLKVALIEKGRLAEWTTGSTTAKLTSQHYLIYDYLTRHHGQATAEAFAAANQAGIESVEQISKKLGIECEFERCNAYVYTQKDDKLNDIQNEVEAAKRLGLPASFETAIDLPYDIAGAIKFSNQAKFHPRKFLLAVAKHFVDNGGVIYEKTKATGILPGDPNTVTTEGGIIKAHYILQASGEPFWNKDIFDGFMWIKMSYALGVKLKDRAEHPGDMYITTDEPMRTIRSATYEGKPLLIFGGESHEYDEATYDEELHYRALIEDVRKRYDVDKVLFRWLAGDYMPYDRMPYIGSMPGYPAIYTITGYRAWGLAWAMSATNAVVNDIVGHPDQWVKHFSLERLSKPIDESQKTNYA